jgi:fatty acid desaturase
LYYAGLATAWIFINPVSIVLITIAKTGRWAMLGHHVGHGAYDRLEGVPKYLHSKHFAKGGRRIIDWMDWLLPGAWEFEHNVLHHYHTGEMSDPDFPQKNTSSLRIKRLPVWLKYLYAFFLMSTWKILYYAPNTLWYLEQKKKSNAHLQKTMQQEIEKGESFPGARIYSLAIPEGRRFWMICVLPYLTINFMLLPALFLSLGIGAALNVLISLVIAEVLTNLHSFTIIVTNHAGEDIPSFDAPVQNKQEFYLRQIIGSVNYTGGKYWSDFLQGYANYQIEHHLWPRLPMLQYKLLQPEVQKLCEKHGVPYVRENVFRRLRLLLDMMVGKAEMKVLRTDFRNSPPTPLLQREGSTKH